MPTSDFYQKEAVRDIIGREPSWILTSGISLVALITVILLSITWFIQYPDSIRAKVTVQTIQAIVKHKAKLDGHLNQIMSKDGEKVKESQVLALIDNQLDYNTLIDLEAVLIEHEEDESYKKLLNKVQDIARMGQLMELQEHLNLLIKRLKNWQRLIQAKSITHDRKSTKELVGQYKRLIKELVQKQQTLQQQIKLAQGEVDNKESLVSRSLLAKQESVKAEQTLLQLRSQLNDIKINMQLYQLKLSELQQELVLKEIRLHDDVDQHLVNINEQRSYLLSKIREWKEQHLILAQTSGTLSFNQHWKNKQFVQKGDTLFNIIPLIQQMDAWMIVSGKGVGKIKAGQKVQIELENYPATEFGLLEGMVRTINAVPDQEGYLVKIDIPNEMTTSYGIAFNSHPYLQGTGKIITQPRRLLTRFTDKLMYAIDKVGT